MTARLFVHPRCVTGPASGALAAELEKRGYDMTKTLVAPASLKGHFELVTLIGEEPDGSTRYERGDGTQFAYKARETKGPGRAA